MTEPTSRKKVLFIITKSNWGEQWEGVKNNGYYSLRGCQLFLKKIATTCTGPVRTHCARPFESISEFMKEIGQKVYRVCKTAPSHPTTNSCLI